MEKLDVIYNSIRKIFPTEEFYLVGGCVRDTLLGKEPKDFDVATNMTPDYMEQKLKEAGRHVWTVGKKFGTISAKIPMIDEDSNIKGSREKSKYFFCELTTYRSEFYNPKSRHPQVKFIGSLKSDLERRDFCINALAYSPKTGIIDYFGGRIDLFSKTIKCVGKACDRFREDPLRILRAVRFATVLDFDIEHNVKQEIKKGKYNLLDVAVERWIIELDKILESSNPEKGIKLLVETELWSIIFPEIPEEKALSLQLSNWPIGDYRLREIIKLTGHINHYKKGQLKDSFYRSLYQYIGLGICQRLKLSNKRNDFLLETNKSTNK